MSGALAAGPGGAAGGPVLFLSGTDHHRFDRLVDWADTLARDTGAHVLVQHGSSRPPAVAEGHPHLDHAELLRLLAQAPAVVCHGGPGLISDARRQGHRPVCVPRDPALGEHVDGHQLRFAAVADRAGLVRLATTIDELTRAITEARHGRPVTGGITGADPSYRRLAGELDPLIGSRPLRRSSVLRRLRSKVVEP